MSTSDLSAAAPAGPTAEVAFGATAPIARESGFQPATLMLRRAPADGPLTLACTAGGTAVAGKDYVALPGTVTFAAGQRDATLTVQPLVNYRSGRQDETVTVTIGGSATTTVTIFKDPAPKPLPADARFFSALQLDWPALSAVRAAVATGDYRAARAALAAYYRQRTKPVLPARELPPDLPTIEAARQHRYTISGITHQFTPGPGGGIDWSFNPSTDAEWVWQLNRFPWWTPFVAAYRADPARHEAYARALFAELQDWLATSPLNVSDFNQPGSRWRNLETGIRLEHTWTLPFLLLKDSPLLGDDLLVDWVKAFYLHARHLEANAELHSNRGATEANGLLAAGAIFPEFREAAGWRQLALDRMATLVRTDVMPDGAENEFSPGYHLIVVGSLEGFLSLAAASGLAPDPLIESSLRQLDNYLLLASDPRRQLPLLNDSFKFSIVRPIARAFRRFPDRADFQWIAAAGAAGRPPDHTSHLFPDAGQAVMRSAWTPEACYLLMDAGPFGTSHGNEDKLSLSVSGYGVRFLIDCGPYDYEPGQGPRGQRSLNPYRNYSVGSHGKTIPLIDDLDQNRRAERSIWGRPARQFSPVVWRTSDRFDYAAGTYGASPLETWDFDQLRPGRVTRHVFFLKPDVWVVIDAFRPFDTKPHSYSGLFQCSADTVGVDEATHRVTIQLQPGQFDPDTRTTVTARQPSLTLTPLPAPGLSLTVVKGQDLPVVSGYQFEKSTTWKKQPIPTARYERASVVGDACLAYVLAAAPAGDAPRRPTISTVDTAADTEGVKVALGPAAGDRILLVARDGAHLTWQRRPYTTPAMIVTGDDLCDWTDTPHP